MSPLDFDAGIVFHLVSCILEDPHAGFPGIDLGDDGRKDVEVLGRASAHAGEESDDTIGLAIYQGIRARARHDGSHPVATDLDVKVVARFLQNALDGDELGPVLRISVHCSGVEFLGSRSGDIEVLGRFGDFDFGKLDEVGSAVGCDLAPHFHLGASSGSRDVLSEYIEVLLAAVVDDESIIAGRHHETLDDYTAGGSSGQHFLDCCVDEGRYSVLLGYGDGLGSGHLATIHDGDGHAAGALSLGIGGGAYRYALLLVGGFSAGRSHAEPALGLFRNGSCPVTVGDECNGLGGFGRGDADCSLALEGDFCGAGFFIGLFASGEDESSRCCKDQKGSDSHD